MPYFLCIAFQSFKIKVDSFRILFLHRFYIDEGGVYFGQLDPFLWNKKKANDDWFLCQIGSFCVDRRGRDILELCRRVPLYHCHPSFPGLHAATNWEEFVSKKFEFFLLPCLTLAHYFTSRDIKKKAHWLVTRAWLVPGRAFPRWNSQWRKDTARAVAAWLPAHWGGAKFLQIWG